MEESAKARFTGTVRRVWSNDKVAIITVNNGKARWDIFAMQQMRQAGSALREHDSVEITCDIWSEKLVDRGKQEVVVDGYPKYVPKFVATEIVKLGGGRSAPLRDPPSNRTPAADVPPGSDDNIPF